MNERTDRFSEPQEEPLFVAIKDDDPRMAKAYAQALETIAEFRGHVLRSGDHLCSAKLRFRDPDESERLGEDALLYLWLTSVVYHPEKGIYSGVFFELPPEMTKWHHVGQRLGFKSEDVFDWMVNDHGHLHGGFTLRVVRDSLPESERAHYDQYTGVTKWEPLPR